MVRTFKMQFPTNFEVFSTGWSISEGKCSEEKEILMGLNFFKDNKKLKKNLYIKPEESSPKP